MCTYMGVYLVRLRDIRSYSKIIDGDAYTIHTHAKYTILALRRYVT